MLHYVYIECCVAVFVLCARNIFCGSDLCENNINTSPSFLSYFLDRTFIFIYEFVSRYTVELMRFGLTYRNYQQMSVFPDPRHKFRGSSEAVKAKIPTRNMTSISINSRPGVCLIK